MSQRKSIRLILSRQGQTTSAPTGRTTEAATRARRGASQEPSRSIRLNIKAPPSRLREIKGDSSDEEPAPTSKRGRSSLGRASKNKKPIVDKSSDEEEEEELEQEEQEEDAAGEEDDEADEQDEEEEDEMDIDEEEDEEDDDDEDESMQDLPATKPNIKISGPREQPKSTATARLKQAGVTPVEDKELASSMASDDDEEDDEDPEEDPPDLQNMPDDDDLEDTIRADGLADSDLDSSDPENLDSVGKGSVRRRRDADPESLLALSNEAQKKKFFTADEISMRRAEMARRRKDLSEKRNEEEKANTLKRLLEKPAPTRRSRAQVLADMEREEFGPGRGAGSDAGEDDVPRAKSTFVRTVMGVQGSVVAVPDEWLDNNPAGRIFDGAAKPRDGEAWNKDTTATGRMVQVVD